MCRNLSRIMRYITNTAETTVTLREELDYVQKYLYCMKVRYQSSLNYSIDVDESLLDQPVPKLIIQPIVENAIKYGSDCEPPWTITISSTINQNSWQIDVTDTGPGFTRKSQEKNKFRYHECHSKSDWRKLPRIPFTKIFPACVFPKTGLAVALFQTKGNVNVFPICRPAL